MFKTDGCSNWITLATDRGWLLSFSCSLFITCLLFLSLPRRIAVQELRERERWIKREIFIREYGSDDMMCIWMREKRLLAIISIVPLWFFIIITINVIYLWNFVVRFRSGVDSTCKCCHIFDHYPNLESNSSLLSRSMREMGIIINVCYLSYFLATAEPLALSDYWLLIVIIFG